MSQEPICKDNSYTPLDATQDEEKYTQDSEYSSVITANADNMESLIQKEKYKRALTDLMIIKDLLIRLEKVLVREIEQL